MRQIVVFALQRRPLVILLYFAFVALGLWGFTRLHIEAYPAPVRGWIRSRGGLSSRLLLLRGRELAAIYPRCR